MRRCGFGIIAGIFLLALSHDFAPAHVVTGVRPTAPLDAEGRPHTDGTIPAGVVLRLGQRALDRVATAAASNLGELRHNELPRELRTASGTIDSPVELHGGGASVQARYRWQHAVKEARLSAPIESLALEFLARERIAVTTTLPAGAMSAWFRIWYSVDPAGLISLVADAAHSDVPSLIDAVYTARPRNFNAHLNSGAMTFRMELPLMAGDRWFFLDEPEAWSVAVEAGESTEPMAALSSQVQRLGGAERVLAVSDGAEVDDAVRRFFATIAALASTELRGELHGAMRRALAPVAHAVEDCHCPEWPRRNDVYTHFFVDRLSTQHGALTVAYNGLIAECGDDETTLVEFLTLDHQLREIIAIGPIADDALAEIFVPRGNLTPVMASAMLRWVREAVPGGEFAPQWGVRSAAFLAVDSGAATVRVQLAGGQLNDPDQDAHLTIDLEFAVVAHAGGRLALEQRSARLVATHLPGTSVDDTALLGDALAAQAAHPAARITVPLGTFFSAMNHAPPRLHQHGGYLVISYLE